MRLRISSFECLKRSHIFWDRNARQPEEYLNTLHWDPNHSSRGGGHYPVGVVRCGRAVQVPHTLSDVA
eukprot:11799370-Alexandrium_andersonii.AAC.1